MANTHRLMAILDHVADANTSARFAFVGRDAERLPDSAMTRGYKRMRGKMARHEVNTRWPVDCDGFTVTVTRTEAEQLRRDQLGGVDLEVEVSVYKYKYCTSDRRSVVGLRLRLENLRPAQ